MQSQKSPESISRRISLVSSLGENACFGCPSCQPEPCSDEQVQYAGPQPP